MRAGEKCDYMYVVYSGRVVLQGAMDQQVGGRGVRSHGSQRERHCRPGEVFNEGALKAPCRASPRPRQLTPPSRLRFCPLPLPDLEPGAPSSWQR